MPSARGIEGGTPGKTTRERELSPPLESSSFPECKWEGGLEKREKIGEELDRCSGSKRPGRKKGRVDAACTEKGPRKSEWNSHTTRIRDKKGVFGGAIKGGKRSKGRGEGAIEAKEGIKKTIPS